MKIHVGVLVIVYLGAPENRVAAICRQRNPFNMDGPGHSLKKQSFSGCYQITVRGKQIGEETEGEVLARETLEKIGIVAAYELLGTGAIFAPKLLFTKDDGKGGISFRSYVAYRPQLFYKIVAMDISGSPRLIFEEQLSTIETIVPDLHKGGVTDGKIRFFDDEREVLIQAFKNVRTIGIENLMPHFNRRIITSPSLLPDDVQTVLPIK